MSHVAAQLFDIHVPIYLGTCLKEDVSSHPPILTCLPFTQVSSSFSLTLSPPPLFPPPPLILLFCFSSHLILLSQLFSPISFLQFFLFSFCFFFSGCAVYFCQPDALKGSLTVTMREVRPTLFFSVPRVWEKIQEKMVQMGRQTTGIKKVTDSFQLYLILYSLRAHTHAACELQG